MQAIHYLDVTTTVSPVATRLHLLSGEPDATTQLLAALSTALDLTEGQLPGHAQRTTYLAMRIGDALDLSAADRSVLFYASFLKDAGCSSNAAAVSRIFGGDDQVIKGRQATTDQGILAHAAFAMRNVPASEPLPLRLRRLVAIGLRGRRAHQAVEQLRCERGAAIAGNAGFSPAVGQAIHDVHEHWAGHGLPRGLRHDAIDRNARIIAACAALDIFVTVRGRADALSVLATRRGDWYDPEIVDVLLEMATRGLLDDLAAPDLVGRTMDLEPVERTAIAESTDVDRLAGAFADIVDAKSPFTGSHSRRVGSLAEAIAERIGLDERTVVEVRRAGLLHDLGKLGVPNRILDKPGRLDPTEFAVIQRHPELTLRILEPVPAFRSVAELAACHHERLDGRGYFRGLTAPHLSLAARIVAVADVYEALTADRPYRSAMPTEAAIGVLRDSAGEHLAADVVETLALML